MDSSSGTDDSARGSRPRGRAARRRPPQRDVRGPRGSSSGSAPENAGITDKMSALASTLQDTSRNLNKVDRMLGQYRDHTDGQAEAMALLKENLEESIGQLQAQRLRRRSASASASTLHTSDLEPGSGSEGQRFYPTSPLKDYPGSPLRRWRSRSASVRFKDPKPAPEDVHCLHQSLRDLRSDQVRLSDDLDREILLRNRSDVDTRRAMENLTEHLAVSQTHDSMREDLLRTGKEKQELQRVRLELQREVSLLSSRPHGQRPDGGESSGAPARPDLEREVTELRARLGKASVLSEVEELKKALERGERERLQLCVQVESWLGPLPGLPLTELVASSSTQPTLWSPAGPDRHLACLEHTFPSAAAVLTTDLARREQQQLRMLDQLRDIQSRGKAEQREAQALLQESSRSREELKVRAQEAVRQWRAKCRRLQKELEETKDSAQLHASQATREKEGSQAQLKTTTVQTEAVRRELTEVLGRLAHREEELHRRDVGLSEAQQRHLSLEQENQELRESSAALQEEALRHASLQARLRQENQRLEEQADAQARNSRREQETHASLQASLKEEAASARAQLDRLTQRLAAEESSGRDLQRDLRAKLSEAQDERSALGQQLQLEREVHRKELESLRAVAMVVDGGGRSRKEREVQEALRLCREERDEMQARLTEVKVEVSSEKEQSRALRLKLDRMKEACDKLAQEHSAKEEERSLLHRKYQQIKQEVDSRAKSGAEQRRSSEAELVSLGEKVSRLEAEQEAVLSSAGEELDIACRGLARNAEDKLQAISQIPGLVKDPHRWLAETKSKLRWLCEEVREREGRERRLRRQQQQAKEQLKETQRSRDQEQETLLQRLHQQEKLILEIICTLGHPDRAPWTLDHPGELLDRSRQTEEEMRGLQDRVVDLEMNTRVALDHLESMPEKVSLVENFRDLEESRRQRDSLQQRYTRHRDVDEKLEATSRGAKLAALSSSGGPSRFLSSSLRSDT
ncbi:hypothetical protein NHX12_026114, partial [Muraenolepis orangiensis]